MTLPSCPCRICVGSAAVRSQIRMDALVSRRCQPPSARVKCDIPDRRLMARATCADRGETTGRGNAPQIPASRPGSLPPGPARRPPGRPCPPGRLARLGDATENCSPYQRRSPRRFSIRRFSASARARSGEIGRTDGARAERERDRGDQDSRPPCCAGTSAKPVQAVPRGEPRSTCRRASARGRRPAPGPSAYRLEGSFWRHLRQIVSRSASIDRLSCAGATGSSSITCLSVCTGLAE